MPVDDGVGTIFGTVAGPTARRPGFYDVAVDPADVRENGLDSVIEVFQDRGRLSPLCLPELLLGLPQRPIIQHGHQQQVIHGSEFLAMLPEAYIMPVRPTPNCLGRQAPFDPQSLCHRRLHGGRIGVLPASAVLTCWGLNRLLIGHVVEHDQRCTIYSGTA